MPAWQTFAGMVPTLPDAANKPAVVFVVKDVNKFHAGLVHTAVPVEHIQARD